MKVIDVFVAPKNVQSKIRQKEDRITLEKGYGIHGDKFAGGDLNKSVLITPVIAYDILENEGIELVNGSLGENILVDGNIMELPVGTKLKIGSALLKITEKCTLCSHLAYFDKRVPKLIKDYRGVYAHIIEGGTIQKGMDIEIQ